MSKKQNLQQQLETKLKETEVLRKKIEAEKLAKQPKTIMVRANTFAKVLKIAKPTKEELAIINYKGKSKRLLFANHTMVCALIAEVLNEGKTDNWWFPWFKNTGSGFVCDVSGNSYYGDFTAVGAALRFENQAKSDFAAKTFPTEFKNLMTSQQQKSK